MAPRQSSIGPSQDSCYTYQMFWKRFVFCLICVLLWPTAMFVLGQFWPYLFRLLWWMVLQTGATSMSQADFVLATWLPLAAAEGFILGLVPTHQLRSWLAAMFARFQSRPFETTSGDLDLGRPALWAWVVPSTLFTLRFLLWSPPEGRSVFGDSPGVGRRFDYFFGPATASTLANPDRWFTDRLYFTGPMLFLLAYPVAVWIRHHVHLAQHSLPSQELDPIPLIHSAPDPDLTEPTEIQPQHGSLPNE